jgi:PleD family two-component response regulator
VQRADQALYRAKHTRTRAHSPRDVG